MEHAAWKNTSHRADFSGCGNIPVMLRTEDYGGINGRRKYVNNCKVKKGIRC